MKSFGQFIFICEEKKGRSGPKYNYEVALVRLYNHLIKGTDKNNNKGKILRGLVSRGNTEELTDFLAQELNAAKNSKKHPLHFDNADDEGFTGGKKTDAHRDSYYSELEDQFYTFLNDSQSKLGKSLISQGYTVKRLGDDKIPLSKSGKSAYGKESDTSKADIVFQHPTRPERENYSSLKKASGAVSASAGADETAGNYTVGMRNALQLAVKSGKITKEQAKKLEAEGDTRISALKDAMSGSKGMSKEQQKDLLPQLDKLRGNIEDLIPGTERETAKAQLSGAGKFQKAIDSFLSTGRGGGRKKKPEEVSGTNQRMRLGKGTTKTKEGPVQRPVTSTGDIKAPKTGEPSTFASFSKQTTAAQKALDDAEREQADASVIRFPNGKPVPRKNQYYLQNNPGAAQQHAAKQEVASQAVDMARSALDTISQKAAELKATPKPQQQEKPSEPAVTQPTKKPEPVDTKPSQQPEQPKQPDRIDSPMSDLKKKEEKKKKPPVKVEPNKLDDYLNQE